MENESCKSIELKRWIVTEIRWNKNWVSLAVVARKIIYSLTQIADELQCYLLLSYTYLCLIL